MTRPASTGTILILVAVAVIGAGMLISRQDDVHVGGAAGTTGAEAGLDAGTEAAAAAPTAETAGAADAAVAEAPAPTDGETAAPSGDEVDPTAEPAPDAVPEADADAGASEAAATETGDATTTDAASGADVTGATDAVTGNLQPSADASQANEPAAVADNAASAELTSEGPTRIDALLAASPLDVAAIDAALADTDLGRAERTTFMTALHRAAGSPDLEAQVAERIRAALSE